jgi:hypothetical protein
VAALVVFLPASIANALASTGRMPWAAAVAVAVVAQVGTAYLFQALVLPAARTEAGGRRASVAELFASAGSAAGPVVGAAVLVSVGIAVGLVLLVVPGLYLLVVWSLVVPVIVVERRGVAAALARSRELVGPSAWRVLAVLAVVFAFQVATGLLVTTVGLAAAPTPLGAGAAQLVAYALAAPPSALAVAVMYLELADGRSAAGWRHQ